LLILKKKRTIEPQKIVAPDNAIACLVVKPQQRDTSGTVIPPPPMPETFAKPTNADRTIRPTNSGKYIGKILLCSQIRVFSLHTWK